MKKVVTILLLFIFCGVLSSCGKNYEIPEDIGKNIVDNESIAENEEPFEDEGGQVIGFIQHGESNPVIGENGNKIPFVYDGQEMSIDYEFKAEGKGKTLGFLMFVNGRAQSYRVDSSQNLEYCHMFQIEDEQEKQFTFHFFPIEGKKGETVSVEIVSVFNPSFAPDMENTTSYGWYHRITNNHFTIQMKQDVTFAENTKQSNMISRVNYETEKVTKEYLETNLFAMGWSGLTTESLNNQTYYEILYDGKITYDNKGLKKGGNLSVSYSLCGSPGVEYVTTLFINHMPMEIGDDALMQTVLSKGDVSTWKIELNAENIPNLSTFYIISVPKNAEDYGDVNAMVIKTDSLCLFKED